MEIFFQHKELEFIPYSFHLFSGNGNTNISLCGKLKMYFRSRFSVI